MRTDVALRMLKMRAKLARKEQDVAASHYALGVLTTLEWLLDQDSVCPYPDIYEDLGEGGGWITGVPSGTAAIPTAPRVSAALPTTPAAVMPNDVTAGDEPITLLDANGDPVVPPEILAAASNSRVTLTPALSTLVAEHPWVKRELEMVGISGYTPGDHNTVVVGAGLNDGPVLGSE